MSDDELTDDSIVATTFEDKCIRRVFTTRTPISSASNNQDEEKDIILIILKLGNELRDSEQNTKQKYIWMQDDGRY